MSRLGTRLTQACLAAALVLSSGSVTLAREQRATAFKPTAAQCAGLPELDARLRAASDCQKSAAKAKSTINKSCFQWWLFWASPSCMTPPSCTAQVDAYYSYLTGSMGLKNRSGIPRTAGQAEAVNGQLRLACAAPSSTAPGTGAAKPPAKPPAITTGLGEDIDKLIAKSPTMLANFKKIMAMRGVKIVYGPAGGGSKWSNPPPTMTIDSNNKTNDSAMLTTLAHESGHALYTPKHVSGAGLSRDEYVRRNVDEALRNEGEATLVNIKIRDEYAKSGINIRVASGSNANVVKYVEIYKKYPKPGDRAKARQEIANWFRDHEIPSGDAARRTYGVVYSERWGKRYDDLYGRKKP